MGCCNSIVVNAPLEQVWAALRDFHDMSWAGGVIESCEAVGELPGTAIGAQRKLNGLFEETLLALDDDAHRLAYQIVDAPGTPIAKDKVANYIGELQVFTVTASGGTFVYWTSRWQNSQGGVSEFCDPIYKALLDALAAHFA